MGKPLDGYFERYRVGLAPCRRLDADLFVRRNIFRDKVEELVSRKGVSMPVECPVRSSAPQWKLCALLGNRGDSSTEPHCPARGCAQGIGGRSIGVRMRPPERKRSWEVGRHVSEAR